MTNSVLNIFWNTVKILHKRQNALAMSMLRFMLIKPITILSVFIFSRSESFPVSFLKNYGQLLMKSHGVKLKECVILSRITMAAFGWKSFGIL